MADKISGLEGDEVAGITEEAEEALKPEERSLVQIMWTFAKYPFWLSAITFFISFFALWYSWGFARGLAGALILSAVTATLSSVLVIQWTKIIPSSPPFVGVVTSFGRITKWVAPAGYFLTIPYIRDVILIDMRRIDQDFKLENVATKDNAIVAVKGHLSFQPDPRRLPMYIKSGIVERGEKNNPSGGVMLITDNLFPQYQRTEIKKLPLDDALGASETLSAGIAKHLTGEKDFDRGNMARDGRSDTKGLGITIFVANVTSIETTGETKKALELEVQEKFQRKGEVYEIVTRVRQALAKIFAAKGLDITEMTHEQIKTEVENMEEKDPKFKDTVDSWVTAFIEYESARKVPGSVVPGLRERLIAPGGGSIPLDVIGALLSGLVQKPTEARTKKTETEKPDNKRKEKGKKKKEEPEEEEEEYE